jgi:hypothetical protein
VFRRKVAFFQVNCIFSFFATCLTFWDKLGKWRQLKKMGWNQWRIIICKHDARWLYLSWLKASAAYYSHWKPQNVNKTHQLKPDKGAVFYWVMEPHLFEYETNCLFVSGGHFIHNFMPTWLYFLQELVQNLERKNKKIFERIRIWSEMKRDKSSWENMRSNNCIGLWLKKKERNR